jgi:hypothetical protein
MHTLRYNRSAFTELEQPEVRGLGCLVVLAAYPLLAGGHHKYVVLAPPGRAFRRTRAKKRDIMKAPRTIVLPQEISMRPRLEHRILVGISQDRIFKGIFSFAPFGT